MDLFSVSVVGAGLGVVLLLAAAQIVLRRRRQARDTVALAANVARSRHVPPSLHPVIDPDVCIGSLSCLKACPEGDILGVVNGAARLIHADHCIGHGRCAAECPVDAIKLVFGTAERGVDLPEIDEFFESSRPGVHVVGELGGMGLIKNAVTQGVQCGERLAATLGKRGAPAGTTEVVIVGAGPAGLATALALQQAGVGFRLLEQNRFGGTIAQYPRQKVVMTDPVELPGHGKLGKKLISKEELLETWRKVAQKSGLAVEEGVKVAAIEGQDGAFVVKTDKGEVRARKVVLATGRRGSPRKLGVPGEDGTKVTYNLADPAQYEDAKVLVVGGGDSALEAAIQLANETDAEVTISYRGEAFAKCREKNRQAIEQLVAKKRVRALLPSVVKRVHPDKVELEAGGKVGSIKNDYVIACLGGELPAEFLEKAGVQMKRHFGEERKKPQKREQTLTRLRKSLEKDRAEKKKQGRMDLFYFTVGCLILAWLTIVGWQYYPLSRLQRLHSPLNKMLRPAGKWGHGVGIVATLFMLSNFFYAARKRWRALTGLGTIRGWLTFHMFVGFMSPLVIAFHAAFQSNNLLATSTAGALLVVVLTGIVGRYIYGLVPSQGGKAVELEELLGRWERLRARLAPLIDELPDPAPVQALLERAARPVKGGSLFFLVLRTPFDWLFARLRLLAVRRLFPERELYREFNFAYRRLATMRVQVGFFKSLKRLLKTWRLFHASLAGFLVVAIAAHIAVSIYLGYGLDVWNR